jgi:maltose O-acetyltransferase
LNKRNRWTSGKRWLVSLAFGLIPPTRLYSLKRLLLRLCDIEVGSNVRVVSSARFLGTGPIRLGESAFVGHEVLVVSAGEPVEIGADVSIGPRVCITNGTHRIERRALSSAGAGVSLKVRVEDGAWIGAGALIIAGVSIGRKSVIGAGSVVVQDVPPGQVAVGNPCRAIRPL